MLKNFIKFSKIILLAGAGLALGFVYFYFIQFSFSYTARAAIDPMDPTISCSSPHATGNCVFDSTFSYFCGVKFNQVEKVNIRWTELGLRIKMDNAGNVLLNYGNDKILPSCETKITEN